MPDYRQGYRWYMNQAELHSMLEHVGSFAALASDWSSWVVSWEREFIEALKGKALVYWTASCRFFYRRTSIGAPGFSLLVRTEHFENRLHCLAGVRFGVQEPPRNPPGKFFKPEDSAEFLAWRLVVWNPT